MSSDSKSDNMESKDSNVCRDYMRGLCKRPNCKYSHPNEDDKKQFCHDFQNNRCHRPNCKYLHCTKEEEEYYKTQGTLPPTFAGGGGMMSPSNATDKPLCKDFIHGKCYREDRCKYYHPPQPGPNMPFPGGYSNFGSNFNDFAGGPASKRSRGDLYDEDPASLIHTLREENMMLQGNIAALQRRVQHLEAANEMLLEQNAKLRAGGGKTLSNPMLAQWNGGGNIM